MKCCTPRVRFWYAILGVVIGLTAAPAFMFEMKNVNTTIWALGSSVFAFFLVLLHWYYMKQRIDVSWIGYLKSIMLLGCFGQLGGLLAMVGYMVAAGVLGQGITGDDMYGENYWLASIWGWMVWKWAFQLFWWARVYRREMQRAAVLTPELVNDYGSLVGDYQCK